MKLRNKAIALLTASGGVAGAVFLAFGPEVFSLVMADNKAVIDTAALEDTNRRLDDINRSLREQIEASRREGDDGVTGPDAPETGTLGQEADTPKAPAGSFTPGPDTASPRIETAQETAPQDAGEPAGNRTDFAALTPETGDEDLQVDLTPPAQQPAQDEPAPSPQTRVIEVLSGEDFAMCGYTRFTASLSAVSGAIRLESPDRAIPDRNFRGYETELDNGSEVELWPGCLVDVRQGLAAGVPLFVFTVTEGSR